MEAKTMNRFAIWCKIIIIIVSFISIPISLILNKDLTHFDCEELRALELEKLLDVH